MNKLNTMKSDDIPWNMYACKTWDKQNLDHANSHRFVSHIFCGRKHVIVNVNRAQNQKIHYVLPDYRQPCTIKGE